MSQKKSRRVQTKSKKMKSQAGGDFEVNKTKLRNEPQIFLHLKKKVLWIFSATKIEKIKSIYNTNINLTLSLKIYSYQEALRFIT